MPRVVKVKFTQALNQQIVLEDKFDDENPKLIKASATKDEKIEYTVTTVGGEGRLKISSDALTEVYMIPDDFDVIDGAANSVLFPRVKTVAQEDFDNSMTILENEIPKLKGKLI